MPDVLGGAPAGRDADDVAFDERIVGVGDEVRYGGGEVLGANVRRTISGQYGVGERTFLNVLFHSCSAMRTLTARCIRPAETTTPILELENSRRTMGVVSLEIVAAMVNGWVRGGTRVAVRRSVEAAPGRFGGRVRAAALGKAIECGPIEILVRGKGVGFVVN